MHWAVKYVGAPWVKGAAGPGSYDCWGLMRAVAKNELGLELPAIEPDLYEVRALARAFDAAEERKTQWVPIDKPQEFDCVLLGRSTAVVHAGIYVPIDGGSVLHSLQPTMAGGKTGGVCFQRLSTMQMSGWGLVEFVRHRSLIDVA